MSHGTFMARYSGLPRVGENFTPPNGILGLFGFGGWYEPDDEISGDRVYQAERSTVYVGEYADALSPQQIDEQLHHLCDEYLPADDHGRRATVDWRQRGILLYAALTEPNLQCVSQYQLLFNSMVPVQRWAVIHEFCHVLSIEMTGKGGHGSAFRKALGLVLHGEGRADLMVELERKLSQPHYVPLEIDKAMVGFIPVVEDAFKLHPGEGSWA